MPTSLHAVLFDMDGTLVETESAWGDALGALARRLGGELSAPAREATVGTSLPTALGILYTDIGVRSGEDRLGADVAWVEDAVLQLMAAGVSWRPGARRLLEEVRAAGVPTGLVTTTPRRLARVVLRQVAADLGSDPFDVTVCGDEVPARKPDPAPYLQAMAALGVEAAGCVVIEDSAAGVTAGLAAGAVVLGVPSLQPLRPGPGLTLRAGLAEVGLADLRALVVAREDAGTPV